MKLSGGSLRINELMELLKSSYLEQPPKNIFDFTLDDKLSNLYGSVYFDMNKKKVVIIFRGTKGTQDWNNNLIYSMNSNAYKLTPRFKTAKKMYDNALKKYQGFQFESIGHSQGAILARLLSNNSLNAIQVNPAYKAETLKDNDYIIRSSGDAISALTVPKKMINSVLYPSWTKEHMITIDDKTKNPITEHKIDILKRLPQDMKIGRGGAKPKNKKLYDIVKKEIDIIYNKPSAFKSGAIVKKYKALGGEFIEDGKPKNLKKWFDEEWKNIADDNQYPVMRPTKRINKTTPLTVDEIPKEILKKQIKLKQKIKGNSNLPKFKL